MSKMNKESKKMSFLLTASTRELLGMPTEVILEEVAQRFRDLRKDFQKGSVADKLVQALERRMAHSSILLVEAGRLEVTHPEEAQKIYLASIFWKSTEGFDHIVPERKQAILDRVAEIEEEERRKAEEERKKRLGLK